MKEYAIYKGEQILAIGTAFEIAKILGVKQKSVYSYICNRNMELDKGKRKVGIIIN